MSVLVCPQCNHENKTDYRFCTCCGVRLNISYKTNTPRLVMLHGSQPDLIFYLNRPTSSIGRDKRNSIVLHDTQISNQHARIWNNDDQYWIEDTGSKNGIFINGKRVEKKEHLLHGCLIKMGSTILRFENTREQ